jgi:hypothetical protein
MPPSLLLRATGFEFRHQMLLRQSILAAAFSTYLLDPDDVVWRFIRQYPSRRALEHFFFALATFLIAVAAILCTRARATLRPPAPNAPIFAKNGFGFLPISYSLGQFLFDLGIATLAPLWGAVLLVVAEAFRLLRLQAQSNFLGIGSQGVAPTNFSTPSWGRAFRLEAAKWGIFVTMVVFSITLIDRLAESLAVASILIAVILNLPSFDSKPGSGRKGPDGLSRSPEHLDDD